MDGWKDTMASGADGYDGAVVRGIYKTNRHGHEANR